MLHCSSAFLTAKEALAKLEPKVEKFEFSDLTSTSLSAFGKTWGKAFHAPKTSSPLIVFNLIRVTKHEGLLCRVCFEDKRRTKNRKYVFKALYFEDLEN